MSVAPTVIGQKATRSKGVLTVSWSVSSLEGVGGFLVHWRPKETPAVPWGTDLCSSSARSVQIPNVDESREYEVQVRVLNAGSAVTFSVPVVPAPKPKPEPTGLVVGLCGLTDHGPEHSRVIVGDTGVTRDRIDVTGSLSSRVKESVEIAGSCLVLYSPTMKGRPVGTIQADMQKLAEEMKALGLTELEFGNEAYYDNGFDAEEYGAQYKAAHEALKGTGIVLFANAYTGGDWNKTIATQFGHAPDAWSLHPYGAMNEKNLAENEGWQIVPALLETMKAGGYAAPLHITEVGQPVWQGSDNRPAVNETEQANDAAQYVKDAARWGCASFYWFGATEFHPTGSPEESGGYGLYDYELKARPSAASYGTAIRALAA